MKMLYVAGPYRAGSPHGIVENIRRAEVVALKYWNKGYAVICPHKNTALLDGAAADTVWLEGDLEMIRRSDTVVMMNGWEKSQGASSEHALAKELDLEIIYEQPAE